MQGQTTNPAPVRAPCPAPQPASFLGWIASIFGLSGPAYRGAGQPTGSGGVVFGQNPIYRPPRARRSPSCNGTQVGGYAPPTEQSPDNGVPLTQPVLLDGPVTIVVGARE